MDYNKYSYAKIYKIIDEDNNKCYFGSTCNDLKLRMSHHRANYIRKHLHDEGNKNSVYDMFDEYGLYNCKIEIIKYFPCANINELLEEEAYYIKQYPCVNKNIPRRTKKEYYQDNRERLLKYQHNYYHSKKPIKDLIKIA